jgi:glycosyltransferase involved in cell wall biosynthesis
LPIVASRVGGIPEAVADEVSGLLLPPQDPTALAAVVTGLLCDPEKRSVLGAGGRARAAQKFSLDNMVSGNLKVYEEMLD